MFSREQFIQDCIDARSEGQRGLREVMARAVSQGSRLLSALGEPEHAGIETLHRSADLTVLNFTWAPYMNLLPHNHQMFAIIGIYSGREDNLFWRRTGDSIEAAGARSLGAGQVATLGTHVIHSVLNPLAKMTCALHVYGGDFFAPPSPRSEWDHESLSERPWNLETTKSAFSEAEARFRQPHQTEH
jgi:predicted metal-dependent enzyme (double-stranded beta helix superfamily)